MKRRRRCCVCKELFTADPRVGARQKACGRPECQRQRHRMACVAWREAERVDESEHRLRRRLGATEDELRFDVVRDECGSKIKVVLEEGLRLVSRGMRDEWPAKRIEERVESLRLVDRAPRDETAPVGPGP